MEDFQKSPEKKRFENCLEESKSLFDLIKELEINKDNSKGFGKS